MCFWSEDETARGLELTTGYNKVDQAVSLRMKSTRELMRTEELAALGVCCGET